MALYGVESRGLARKIAQAVKARAADAASSQHLHLVDSRRMHRKDSLDADSVGNFPDRESGAVCAPINLDHDALEGLDALLLAFDDLDVNANPIADAEFGQVLAEPPLFELLDNGIHGKKDLSRAPKPTEMRASTQYHAEFNSVLDALEQYIQLQEKPLERDHKAGKPCE